ncbi:MAG: protein kinase [Anaerolineales bacterium]|nr:protein kinase [Anaerolineales bacterium]
MELGSLLYNRYRIKDVLGKGGMGAVYKAIDESLGVQVAVKENFFVDTGEYTRQFKREATVLAGLRHPNLPRVTDHFVIKDQGQYLVMDFIEGEDLKERMNRMGALSEDEVIKIGLALASALNYMHTLNPPVIHRDIKPGNIKIAPNGQVYLVDFGLVKVLQDGQATTTGAKGLTPGYSPPEQYGSASTDARSDIYALGATLYNALTGFPPEDGLARLMNQATLTPLRQRMTKASPKLAKTIEKALSVQLENRYQTALDFYNALLETENGKTILRGEQSLNISPATDKTVLSSQTAGPPAYLYSDSSRPAKKNRTLFWLGLSFGGLVGVGIILVGALYLMGYLSFSPATTMYEPTTTPGQIALETEIEAVISSEEPTITATLEPTATETMAPILPTPKATPIGGGNGKLVFASIAEGAKRPQIYSMNPDGSELFQVTDESMGACQPDLSPDGTQIVFISPCIKPLEAYDGSGLFMINSDGTNLNALPSSLSGDYDPDWSPDGKRIAFTSLRDGNTPQIYSLNIETNEVISLSHSHSSDYQPAWSADGEEILFVTSRVGPTQIWFMEKTGAPDWSVITRTESLEGPTYTNTDPAWSPDKSTIIFTRASSSSLPFLKFVFWEDGTKERGWVEKRVTSEVWPMQEAVFSPDGKWIAFEGYPDGTEHDIYVMTINGTNLQIITLPDAYDFDVSWGT